MLKKRSHEDARHSSKRTVPAQFRSVESHALGAQTCAKKLARQGASGNGHFLRGSYWREVKTLNIGSGAQFADGAPGL